MSKITSNTAVARRLATALSNGAELPASSRTIARFERTTVKQADRWIQPVIIPLIKDSGNTRRDASDFNVLKTKISDAFHPNIR